MDRGANGCIIGSDMTIVSRTNKCIDLTGIEDHTVQELNIVHAACVAKTHLGVATLHKEPTCQMGNRSCLHCSLNPMAVLSLTRHEGLTEENSLMFNHLMAIESP